MIMVSFVHSAALMQQDRGDSRRHGLVVHCGRYCTVDGPFPLRLATISGFHHRLRRPDNVAPSESVRRAAAHDSVQLTRQQLAQRARTALGSCKMELVLRGFSGDGSDWHEAGGGTHSEDL